MRRGKYHSSYEAEQIKSTTVDYTLLKDLLVDLYPYKNMIIFSLVALLIAKVIESVVPILIGTVTQQILDTLNMSGTDHETLFRYVVYSSMGIIGLLVLSYIMEAINVLLKSWVGQKALYTLRNDVYDHILRLPVNYYDRHAIGRLMTRTIHDVDQINQMFAESVVPIVGNVILFICIFIGITWINWRIAIAIACLMPLIFVHINLFRRSQRRSFKHVRVIVSAMNTFMQEHLMGISVIRKFGLLKQELKKFSLMNEDLKTAHLETVYNFSFMSAGIDFATSTFLVVVFVLLVVFAPPEGFQAGSYFALSLYALMTFRPLSDLAERYNVLQAAAAAAERIYNILDQKPEDLDSGENAIEEVTSIIFDDVWFAYDKDDWVLQGLSFEVQKGESIAFVGVTGAGKTTIMSLLMRLYDHQRGRILINGKDIRLFSKRTLRGAFSVVLQDPVIFTGSVFENICMYDNSISKDDVNSAIDYVNLRSFIDKWEGGLEHALTERGKGLSVGEMQLISLARSIACNRSVIVLDEATASIDSKTEKVIQDALKKILREKTTLVIAHRLSTVKEVDKIVVVHEGNVAEVGKHAELLEAGGVYEKLYRLQAESLH